MVGEPQLRLAREERRGLPARVQLPGLASALGIARVLEPRLIAMGRERGVRLFADGTFRLFTTGVWLGLIERFLPL